MGVLGILLCIVAIALLLGGTLDNNISYNTRKNVIILIFVLVAISLSFFYIESKATYEITKEEIITNKLKVGPGNNKTIKLESPKKITIITKDYPFYITFKGEKVEYKIAD